MKTKFASVYRRRAYFLDFLLALEAALASYFNATYMTTRGVSEQHVGMVYSAAFTLGLIGLFFMPRILRRFGNRRTFMYAALVGTGLAICLALSNTGPLVIGFFIAFSTVLLSLRFSLDIFLESSTENSSTGFTRALFLTITNTAFVIAPVLGGWLVADDQFAHLYETTAVLLLILTIASSFALRRFRDPIYDDISLPSVFAKLRAARSIRKLFIIEFFLLASYALETVYLTVYLHENIGFPLAQMGLIFTVSLLPFPLLQLPLGILGDRRTSEKKILLFGLMLMGLMLCVLSYTTSKNPAAWATILFVVSIASAMIEVATESYFFKRVDGRSIGIISVYRALYPIAYIVTPLAISILLNYVTLREVFWMFGGAVFLFGIPAALALNERN